MRNSLYSNIILRILQDADKPISVVNIAELLNVQNLQPNKTTLYRAINNLLEQGKIKEIFIDNKISHYELASKHHHHHFTCNKCKNIWEIDLGNAIDCHKIQIPNNFLLLNHSIETFGLCENCR